MHEIPDQYSRMQIIMADNAVNSIIEAAVSVSLTVPREAFEQAIRAALSVDPLTHYVRGLDSFTDYMQRRSKHYQITERTDGWRERVVNNFNSANDEELKR